MSKSHTNMKVRKRLPLSMRTQSKMKLQSLSKYLGPNEAEDLIRAKTYTSTPTHK